MPKPEETRAPYWVNNETARRLWDAYNRMMDGTPERVKPTARLTLSSVATEAGFQRSTLSKRRYPDLAELIEQSAARKPGQTMHALYEKKSRANRNLRAQLAELRESRGVLLNRLAALEDRYLRMSSELERLTAQVEPSNVVPLVRDGADIST